MEPEPERIDLSSLDPGGWDAKAAAVVARGLERRRLRRAIVRRGVVAVVVAAAAGIAVWWSAPRREEPRSDILDWAVRDVQPSDVLGIGAGQ